LDPFPFTPKAPNGSAGADTTGAVTGTCGRLEPREFLRTMADCKKGSCIILKMYSNARLLLPKTENEFGLGQFGMSKNLPVKIYQPKDSDVESF
jgi:hypothetical protein